MLSNHIISKLIRLRRVRTSNHYKFVNDKVLQVVNTVRITKEDNKLKQEKKIKRVIILGIDALEYDLVEKWNLKNLKQVEYGKTELPLLPGQEPITTIIWPCFITGKMPQEMGYTMTRIFPKPIQFFIDLIIPSIRKLLIDHEAEDRSKKKKGKQSILDKSVKLLDKLGVSHIPTKKDIKANTIFDNKDIKSIHLHIPVYDADAFPKHRKKTIDAVGNKLYLPILEMLHKQEFNQRTKEVFEHLEKNNWQLFMQYFFLLDGVQHAFYHDIRKIAKFYIMFDEFVGKVKEKIDDNTLLLIISDHGQKKGIHTMHGFYSLNKPLGLKKPRLIDFKHVIENLLEKSY